MEGLEVSQALKEGILSVQKDAEVVIKEIADGGEGSLTLLSEIYECSQRSVQVRDALGRTTTSSFGFNNSSKMAVLEMASYVGLASLTEEERDPHIASSHGLGQAINEAVKVGAEHLLMGVGGSATNDGGAGMLQALGFQFLDTKQQFVSPNGGNLDTIHSIIAPKYPIPNDVRITIATDVSNPICGPKGATYTYALQKGAEESELEKLEHNMLHFAKLIERTANTEVLTKEGYGAAGGVPMAASTLLGAEMTSGSQLIFDQMGLAALIKESDIIITGEGKIDYQTMHGKAISPIVASAISQKKKLFLLCGLYDGSSPDLDIHSRYELSKLADELNLDSFSDASQLCVEAGKRLASKLNLRTG